MQFTPVRSISPGRTLIAAAALSAVMVSLTACGSDAPTGTEGDVAASGVSAWELTREDSGSGDPSRSTTAGRCNGTIGNVDIDDDVFVPRGATCTLSGTRVDGNVKVSSGATLIARGARIDGNIQAEDARRVTTSGGTVVIGDIQVKRRAVTEIDNTTIDGNLQIEERGASLTVRDTRIDGDLQVKKAESASVADVFVRGNIQLEENRATLSSSRADVRGDFQLFKNTGGARLVDNRIAQSLQCKENSPAPTGSGNQAGEKEEQCRTL